MFTVKCSCACAEVDLIVTACIEKPLKSYFGLRRLPINHVIIYNSTNTLYKSQAAVNWLYVPTRKIHLS